MKEKVKSDIVLKIENKIEQVLKKENYILIDINVTDEKNKNIIIYLYNEDKINIEELGRINKILYPAIETISYFKDGFTLEISSPGIFRKLKYKQELNIFFGKKMKIITTDGQVFIGISDGLNNNTFSLIKKDEERKIFNINDIKSAELNG